MFYILRALPTDILQGHCEDNEGKETAKPYLAIPHVRDMLIAPSERSVYYDIQFIQLYYVIVPWNPEISNHSICSPSYTVCFFRSALLPTKHFHQRNRCIYIRRSRLQERQSIFGHSIPVLESKQTLNPGPKTIKKNTNSTPNKSQTVTHGARAYEVT